MTKVTPARKQYLDIKAQYPDCILFYRLGDFYEAFDEDAETVSRELEITLTSRKVSKGQRVPMAGVPHHALENYVQRLIDRGYHVAICDQVSEPTGRGIVDREVTRVLTPGTLVEPALLAEDRPNYLMAIVPIGDPEHKQWNRAGIAYADISTGQFATTQFEGDDTSVRVLEELARLAPREVIMPETWVSQGVKLPEDIHLSPVQDWYFEFGSARRTLQEQFRVQTLDGFGLKGKGAAICAAGGIMQYLRTTQKSASHQITSIRTYSTASFMILDQFTRRNLELTETIRGRQTKGSLLGILDRTETAMGARLLRTWIAQPLLEIDRLNARLNVVESLTDNEILREELRLSLQAIGDIERLTNRLLIHKANPRDLIGLRDSLAIIPTLRQQISHLPSLQALVDRLDPCEDVVALIQTAITDEPPATLNNIGIIREGYAEELDAILDSSREAREWIANLEPNERRRTGIPTIKVGYNKVFGYYIEVTKAHSDNVPEDYIRKQTLVNAERYITPELKDYETLVLNAEDEILKTERKIFDDLVSSLNTQSRQILSTANAVAHLDAFLSLASVAVREGYTRPQLTTENMLYIRDGRHPVVERLLGSGNRYVANDTHFDDDSRVHIITGPNMSGKSTYIRQVAIITLMAQLGSFVPADEAVIGLVDRIFARIGAQDEIHAGQSTFMVEMVETARLLTGSSERSLLILDEIGRGTSTYDGLAIARAVIEYIHNNPSLNCRTLFATHYHELTELPNILPRTNNYNVAVAEQGEEIVFLHKVVPGGADQSYGVHVAQIAGMPRPVVNRARDLLAELEETGSDFRLPTTAADFDDASDSNGAVELSPEMTALLESLQALDVNNLTPLEAMSKLYEYQQMARDT